MSMKTFYSSSFLNAISESLIGPFMPIFALYLGATKTLIGLLSSLPNLTGLFSQLFWSSVTETIKKKGFLVVIGGIFWSIFWIPIAYTKDPFHLVVFVTLQALFSSIAIPAWTALLIRLTPSYKRGSIVGYLNTFGGVGSFIGTLVAGFILNKFGFIPFLFYIIFLLGLLSRVQFFFIREPAIPVYKERIREILKRTFIFSELVKNKRLLSLTKAIIFLNFSVAVAGPFFSVYIIEKLSGTNMDIAIISSIGVITAITFYRSWGKLIDYLGKKTIMLSCLIPISFIPFVYAISNHIFWLYLYAIVGNMSWAGFNMAAFTYFSDILPKERISSNVAMYNLLTGLSSAIAPFFGGLIADFSSIWLVFMISTLLRFFSIYFFDKLEERTGFKPRGIFKFEFEPFGLSYRIETFISTYSLAISEVIKESLKIFNIKRYVKRGE